MTIQVKPVAGRIGAQLEGIKLGGDISAESFEFINQALLKYKVLFFRSQHLDDAEHEAFSRRFGDQVPHPTVRSAEKVPPSCIWMPRKPVPIPGTPM